MVESLEGLSGIANQWHTVERSVNDAVCGAATDGRSTHELGGMRPANGLAQAKPTNKETWTEVVKRSSRKRLARNRSEESNCTLLTL